MTDESKQEREYWHPFDAYIKRVIAGAMADYYRQKNKTPKVITLPDGVIMAYIDKGEEDDYPSNHYCLYVDDIACQVDNEQLYNALQTLPENLLHVLVLKFWQGNSEKEIAESLQVSVRSCYTWRKKALTILKQYMEESRNERTE